MSGEAVGLVVKRGSVWAEEAAIRTVKVLEELGVKVFIESSIDYESLSGYPKFSLSEDVPGKLIVVGGDGTLLRTILRLGEKSPIIMAVRAGKRGFLLDVERYEVEERVRDFIRGDYKVIEYPKQGVYLNGKIMACVLNDAVVISKMARMVRLSVSIDSYDAMRVDGDGVIISTTLGSTAYSLSAGGPIVDPRLDIMVITPINPVQLHMRPIVVPGDSIVEVTLSPQSNEAYLSLDGEVFGEATPGSLIAVKRCSSKARIARFRWWENFYERLHTRILTYW